MCSRRWMEWEVAMTNKTDLYVVKVLVHLTVKGVLERDVLMKKARERGFVWVAACKAFVPLDTKKVSCRRCAEGCDQAGRLQGVPYDSAVMFR